MSKANATIYVSGRASLNPEKVELICRETSSAAEYLIAYTRSGARVVLREVDRHSPCYRRDVDAMDALDALLLALSQQMKFQLVVS